MQFRLLAILLFELGKDYRRAAACALQLRQTGRAAKLFERGRAWAEAAQAYEKAEQWRDALRVLEVESRVLEQEGSSRDRPVTLTRLQDVRLKRADLLLRLGKTTQALELLRQVPSSGERRSR